MYAVMVALFEPGAAIDYHTVGAELQRLGLYEAAGGLLFLADLDIATPTSIAVLGLLVVIRTFLSWSLVVEIEGRWPWQPARGGPEPGSRL